MARIHTISPSTAQIVEINEQFSLGKSKKWPQIAKFFRFHDERPYVYKYLFTHTKAHHPALASSPGFSATFSAVLAARYDGLLADSTTSAEKPLLPPTDAVARCSSEAVWPVSHTMWSVTHPLPPTAALPHCCPGSASLRIPARPSCLWRPESDGDSPGSGRTAGSAAISSRPTRQSF